MHWGNRFFFMKTRLFCTNNDYNHINRNRSVRPLVNMSSMLITWPFHFYYLPTPDAPALTADPPALAPDPPDLNDVLFSKIQGINTHIFLVWNFFIFFNQL